MQKIKLLSFFILISLFGIAQKSHKNTTLASITNGKELINAMHAKYANGKWYKHFTFSQNMEYYRNDSIIKKDIWHEAATFPGNLVIKFKDKKAKNGVLFENNMVHSYAEGKEPITVNLVHDLLLVG